MNEAQRQAALEAMGIDSWFPRFVLPGAAPSRPCEWPEELPLRVRTVPAPVDATSPPAASARAMPEAPARRERPSVAREALAGELAEPRRKAAAQEAPTAAPRGPAGKSVPVRFRLVFLRCGPVAVLNQLPFLGSESLGAAPRQLFLNLAQALGWPPESVRVREDSFRWPFAETMTIDAGAEAARLALRAYVEHMADESPFRAVLVLGGQLAPFVLPADWDGEAASGRLLRAPGLPWPVLLSRSLDELLSLPSLKRQAWRDLAPLAAFAADA